MDVTVPCRHISLSPPPLLSLHAQLFIETIEATTDTNMIHSHLQDRHQYFLTDTDLRQVVQIK